MKAKILGLVFSMALCAANAQQTIRIAAASSTKFALDSLIKV